MQREINTTIGVRLAAFMASKGLTRLSLAAALDTSPHRIARFESGHSEMSAAELVLAARALGVTPGVLSGEETFGNSKGRIFPLPYRDGRGWPVGLCVGERFDGWIMALHPDGQWVSVLKLESIEPASPLSALSARGVA